jgi:hypothetical protein
MLVRLKRKEVMGISWRRTNMGKNSRNVRARQAMQQAHLSAAQIRRLAKPRSGFEGPAQQLLTCFLEQPNSVVPKGFDVAAALAKITQYQAMTSTVRNKKLDFEAAADTQLQLGSDIWQIVRIGYLHAKAAARTNPTIAAAIQPFEAFMRKSHGKRKTRTAPASSATAPR